MINQSFSYSSLARCLYSKDFYDDENLSNEEYRKIIINNALEISNNLFNCRNKIDTIIVGCKVVYSTSELSEKLVLRRCVENIKYQKVFSLKQRDVIGKELITYLKEGTPYTIYRFDIKSFFESISVNDIKESLENIRKLSTLTKNLVFSYLDRFRNNHGEGIPRGIEISPVISEILLQGFDKRIKNNADVFYYSRFVDDIMILTSSDECSKKFTRWVRKGLPKSLCLNNNKKYIGSVKKRKRSLDKEKGTEVARFDYLGYEYSVIDTKLSEKNKNQFFVSYREVVIDLSRSKINKLKTKISQSFYSHYKYNDFSLLYDRLFFLISNRDLKDRNKNRTIPTGIYYNYSLISKKSEGLNSLDEYLKFSIQSSKTRLGKLLYNTLTKEERNKLLKLSFYSGFNKRIYKKYSPDRLKQITKIW
jgi:hypothetical protein